MYLTKYTGMKWYILNYHEVSRLKSVHLSEFQSLQHKFCLSLDWFI